MSEQEIFNQVLAQHTLERVIAENQMRVRGASDVVVGLELSSRFDEACRRDEPVPLWALVIRAMADRIKWYEHRPESR